MDISVVSFVQGARQAKGIAVIIDVFRAFSVACYCFDQGARKVYPVGEIDDARSLAKTMDESLLIGERKGKMLPGFDYGNSPSEILAGDVSNKQIVHTTHAGTQGIVNAISADEVLTGAFVNARATANYILSKKPTQVTLVKMGLHAEQDSDEDDLCAAYFKCLLTQQPFDEKSIAEQLRQSPFSARFFDPTMPWNPTADYDLCLQADRFDFVLKAQRNAKGDFELIKIKPNN